MTTRLYTPINGVQPEPARYGLLNSKTLAGVASNGERWETGIAVDSVACNATTKITSICSPASSVSGTEPVGGPWTAEPFNVEAEYECSTFGFNAQNYKEKAAAALDICEGKLVEHEFWTGELAQQDPDNLNRYLASSSAVDVTPTPDTAVQPKFGLVLLEQALANCGCGAKGVIHATRGTASALEKLINPQSDYLETRIGTLVIAGTGYTGSGPNGELPGGTKVWMYATGQVSVVLGEKSIVPDTLSEATNVSVNTVSFNAQRAAAVGHDGCCVFAVLVDLSLDYS